MRLTRALTKLMIYCDIGAIPACIFFVWLTEGTKLYASGMWLLIYLAAHLIVQYRQLQRIPKGRRPRRSK